MVPRRVYKFRSNSGQSQVKVRSNSGRAWLLPVKNSKEWQFLRITCAVSSLSVRWSTALNLVWPSSKFRSNSGQSQVKFRSKSGQIQVKFRSIFVVEDRRFGETGHVPTRTRMRAVWHARNRQKTPASLFTGPSREPSICPYVTPLRVLVKWVNFRSWCQWRFAFWQWLSLSPLLQSLTVRSR